MAEITNVIAEQRAALSKREARALARLADAYLPIKNELEQTIAELADELQAIYEEGGEPPQWTLVRLARSRSLLEQTQIQLNRFGATDLAAAIADEKRVVVSIGEEHALKLIDSVIGVKPPGATVLFDRLPVQAINNLTATTIDGPLALLLETLGRDAAQTMRRELINGVATGKHPYEIARLLSKQIDISFSRAALITRTEVLRSYRESTRQTYAANSHIVSKYIWHARLSDRTCATCWALHGTEFDTSVPMGSHPACRCSLVPKTKSWAELGFKVPEETTYQSTHGPDEFAKQDEATKRKVLGPAAYDAYSTGEITLPSLIKSTDSPQWGTTYTRDSLDNARRKTANQAA